MDANVASFVASRILVRLHRSEGVEYALRCARVHLIRMNDENRLTAVCGARVVLASVA